MRRYKSIVGVLLSAGSVAGCSTTYSDKSENNSEATMSLAAEEFQKHSNISRSSVIAENIEDDFLVGKRFDVSHRGELLPSFFRDKFAFNQIDPVNFSEIVSMINKVVNARVDVSDDAAEHLDNLVDNSDTDGDDGIDLDDSDELIDISVNPVSSMTGEGSGLHGSSLLFHVNYEGDLRGFLDHVLSRVNLSWEWKGDHISIYHTKFEVFTLDQDLSSVEFGLSMSGGAGSDLSFGMQNNFGSFSDEVVSNLDGMVSKYGQYSVSKNLSTIHVRDTPAHLNDIREYVDKINKIAGQQIMMRVQVFDVESNKSGDYGIDWDALFSGSSRGAGSFSSSFIPSGEELFTLNTLGSSTNISAAISSLSRKRNVSTSINTNIHTTNGRPVPFQIGRSEDYISSMRFTIEDEKVIPDFDTDTMETGFRLNLLPRVTSEGSISMTMGMDISEGMLNQANIEDGAIQLKDVNSRSFIQRALSNNGEPVMLAGFERSTEEYDSSSLSDSISWVMGGSKKSNSRKIMTVILITPYIVR